MSLVVTLFITLSQILGIEPPTQSLFCADRVTYTLRESNMRAGCFSTERSLGATAITTARNNPDSIHPKVKLRFEVARRAAASDGVTLYIASGFRSIARQQYLFERAVKKYGSEREAAKWVLPPSLSSHPRGLALDINYPDDPVGAKWLEINGSRFGLCRVYENEWWHFEASTTPGERCPLLLANAQLNYEKK